MLTTSEQYWHGWRGHFIALFAGLLLPLSFSPFQFSLLAIISLALLFFSWQGVNSRQAAWRGFLYGLGMFGLGVSWIYVAIHDFGNASIFLAFLLTLGFVAFLALMPAVLGLLIKKLTNERLRTVDFVLLLPIGWVLFEWFKTWFLTGFPWLEVGVSQINGPLAGYTPVLGSLAVSLLVAITAGAVIAILQSHRWWWILPVAFLWISGSILKQTQWTEPSGKSLQVSLIQGNVPQEIKWNKQQVIRTLALYKKFTEENWDSDLIVWPENSVTAFYHQLKEFYLDPLAIQARSNQTDILLGLPVLDENKEHYFNSMMSLGSKEGFYHKRHLVPFGDYVPLQDWLRGTIEFLNLPMSAFNPGPYSQPLLEVAGKKVGVSICYEDVFSNEIKSALPDAEILVNATNNAWYGDSLAPHQHLQISQNRALEMGRPVLRATTNGISALIDAQGNITAQTRQFEQAVLKGTVQPRQGKTPYVFWGRWPLAAILLSMLLMWMYYQRKYRAVE